MSIFGGNQVTGYNCQQVNDLRDVINNVAQEAGKGIVEKLHNDVVIPMSTAWYAPEAVEFFQKFAETVKLSGEKVTMAFDTFRDFVQKAGTNWAENTGGQVPNLPVLDNVELVLNVSEIQPENAGNVGIDETRANAIATSLTDIEAGIKLGLETLAANLDAESAFIGHNQADAIRTCFITISGEIHKIFKYLTEGEESLQGQINKAVTKYQEISSGISSAFNTSSEQ